MGELAVTGSTGRLGGRVARRLTGPRRLIVRDPARAPVLDDATVVPADYGDAAAARAALSGVDVLFMVSGAETPDRVAQHTTFVDAAVAAGVRHVVYTSFANASPHATFTLARDHFATEEHIRASGLGFTFLRDNLYSDFVPLLVGEDDTIRGPAGDGRVAGVALDDVAAAAVAVLTDPAAHDGATYELTGPRAYTLTEAAAALAAATGRPIRFENETVDEAYASRARYGAPQWQVTAWVTTYTAIAAGDHETVTDDVERLTGHPPRALEDVL